jgi:hypothetical protein
MPVSAYIQAALFVVLNAVALFAAAGTVKILGFWVCVAIFAAVMVASFAFLDPDLLRERMRPGGQRPPLVLRLATPVLILHWIIAGLDHGRFHWSDNVPAWLRAAGFIALAIGWGLTFWAMLVNRFFSSVVRYPVRPRPIRRLHRPLSLDTPPGLSRRHRHHRGERHRARVVAGDGAVDCAQPAVPAVPGDHRGPRAAGRTAGLPRLRGPGALAGVAGDLVRRSRELPRGANPSP